jgi:hypothetical protein
MNLTSGKQTGELLKIDQNGNVLWNRIYDIGFKLDFYFPYENIDGTIMIGGMIKPTLTGTDQQHLIVT